MTTATIAATLIALAIGIAIGALIKDNRIERLRTLLDDSLNEGRNVRAANRIQAAATDLWRDRAIRAEQQAADNELACHLFHGELERAQRAPVVALPVKRARKTAARS